MDRQQFIQIGHSKSVCLNITCGVPKHSVLGSKLFTMYINDMCKVTNILRFVVFADDTMNVGLIKKKKKAYPKLNLCCLEIKKL